MTNPDDERAQAIVMNWIVWRGKLGIPADEQKVLAENIAANLRAVRSETYQYLGNAFTATSRDQLHPITTSMLLSFATAFYQEAERILHAKS